MAYGTCAAKLVLHKTPSFRIDNTDHIFDVNKKQHDHDQVDLVCPQQHSNQQQPASLPDQNRSSQSLNSSELVAQQERYIIYRVSKEEYDTCRLDANGNGRIVALCDQVSGSKARPPVTITFRSYTPQPNGFEYKPGNDYYFITALIGYDSDSVRRFAPCREQNMKVIFKVCCAPPPGAQAPSAGKGSLSSLTSTLLPPHHRLGPSALMGGTASGSSRRPAVITLRPALVVAVGNSPIMKQQQQQQQPSSFDEILRSSQMGSSSAPQPITVLPIEVLQPASNDNNNNNNNNLSLQNDNSNKPSSTEQPSSFLSGPAQPPPFEAERNDIIQSDQQQPAQSPPNSLAGAFARLPHPLPERSPGSAQRKLPPPAFSSVGLLSFDPTAPPEVIMNSMARWTPTPLPPSFTKPPGFGRVPAAWMRPQSGEQQPWQLQQQPATRPHAHPSSQQHQPPSSPWISFYPQWNSHPSASQAHEQPTGELIRVLDPQHQPPSSASASTYGAPALPALLMLILLLLVAFARQQRHTGHH